jgi:hypothetical protein
VKLKKRVHFDLLALRSVCPSPRPSLPGPRTISSQSSSRFALRWWPAMRASTFRTTSPMDCRKPRARSLAWQRSMAGSERHCVGRGQSRQTGDQPIHCSDTTVLSGAIDGGQRGRAGGNCGDSTFFAASARTPSVNDTQHRLEHVACTTARCTLDIYCPMVLKF